MADPGELLVKELMRFRPDGVSANGWAIRAGVSRTIWSDMRRHGNPSRRTLEKLLGAAGSSLAEFEALRVGPASIGVAADADTFGDRNWGWKGAPMAPLRAVECVEAGPWPGGSMVMWRVDPSCELSQAPRPPSLAADRGAYALVVPGTAMAPRFRTGRMIAISPAMTIAIGEDVLVRLRDSADGPDFPAIAGQLRGSADGAIEILQPGNGSTETIPRAATHSVTVIAGELF